MKRICVAVAALLVGGLTGCMVYSEGYNTASAPPPGYDSSYVEGSPQQEVGFFYDDLSPYGDWVLTTQYGWVWFPRHSAAGWRPYTDGRWVDTAYGWTWVSFEPYGWATYHYGRWAQDPRYGWVWVPGTIWGPAWVSWQYGGGYVGWAPLPPSVGFEVGVGLRLGGLSLAARIQPEAYCFVPESSFLRPRISGYLVPRARNVTIIHNTTNITHYGWTENRVVNRGVDLRRIEHATKRRVERFHVREGTRQERTAVHGSEVRFYRPGRDKLDTVRHRPHGESAPPPRQQVHKPAQPHPQPTPRVAPRVERTQPMTHKQIEQRDRREQEQLKKYQDEQRKRLEREHQQELERARAKAERDRAEARQRAEREQARARQKAEQERVQQRQREERARQQEEQRREQEQMKARQSVTRRAVPVRPAAKKTPSARAKPAPRATPTPKPDQKHKKKKDEKRKQKR